MGIRLTGINPLAYMGVEPITPPALTIQSEPPNSNDFQNFNVGTFWLIPDPEDLQLWYLASLAGNSMHPGTLATWIQLYPAGGGSGATEFPCNVGAANEAAGILNILGDGVAIQTSGAGNTVTISILGEVATSFHTNAGTATPAGGVLLVLGGSNINTSGSGQTVGISLDDDVSIPGTLGVSGNTILDSSLTISSLGTGVVQTNSSGLVSSSTGTNGQVLIGGGTAPAWANLTSSGGTVIITNGANSINLESTGGGGGGGGTLSFYAYQPTDYLVPPVAASPVSAQAPYSLGSAVVLTNPLNAGGAFYPGNGAGTPASFTAPVRGRYSFSFNCAMRVGFTAPEGPNNFIQAAYCAIIAPSLTFLGASGQNANALSSWFEAICIASAAVELDVNDVVTFQSWGPTLTTSPMGSYSYRLVGTEALQVFPNSETDYNPTYIQGFLLEQF